MKVRFWGVRGSIPTPGPDTVRTGGNTTCIEVRTAEGELAILDAGSGIRKLGNALLRELPTRPFVFISHTHWDHIQGFPFFTPIFIPKNEIRIFGPINLQQGVAIQQPEHSPLQEKTLRKVMELQLSHDYFPVRADELRSAITYQNLSQGTHAIGKFQVETRFMHHPVLCLGYRIVSGGKSVVFTGDHEPYYNVFEGSDDETAVEEGEDEARIQNGAIVKFVSGADLLIADAQYTAEEYPRRKGWGHSTHEQVMQLAIDAGVKRVAFTHHDPDRSDDALDAIEARLKAEMAARGGPPICASREGLEIEV